LAKSILEQVHREAFTRAAMTVDHTPCERSLGDVMLTAVDNLKEPTRRPSFETLTEALCGTLPLLNELADTPQDPEWHAEGDVATHTAMVLDEAHKQSQFHNLSPEDRQTLLLAALLHDIAKPMTTVRRRIADRMRVVAPRHAARGRSWLAPRLLSLGLPYDQVWDILQLVGDHHVPKKLILENRPPVAAKALVRRVSPLLLYVLALADMRGRRCDDQSDQVELIELFRALCEETHSWGRSPDPFGHWRVFFAQQLSHLDVTTREYITARAIDECCEGRVFTPEGALARHHVTAQEGVSRVWVLSGPSASGKSTWVRENLPDVEVVSLDALRRELTGNVSNQRLNGRVRQLAQARFRAALRAKRDVVWDATNLTRSVRHAILSRARDYRAHTTLVLFAVDPASLAKRNAQREHPVPDGVLGRQLRRVEWPEEHEADRTLHIDAAGQCLRDTRARALDLQNLASRRAHDQLWSAGTTLDPTLT